jgi:hypothetical protein
LLGIFVLFFISCKKKECPAPEEPVNAQGNNYGFVLSYMDLFKSPTGYDSLITVNCCLSKNGQSTGEFATDFVGTVLFNNKLTSFSPEAYKLSVDSGNFLNELKYSNFSINGSTNFSANKDVPFWAKANLANFDSISLSQPLSFDVSDFTNANSGISIDISVNNQTHQLFKYATSGTLTISPSELSSSLPVGHGAYVAITAQSSEDVNVGSQLYKVYKYTRYFYNSKIVN